VCSHSHVPVPIGSDKRRPAFPAVDPRAHIPGMFFNVQSNVFDTFQAMRLPTI